MGTDRVDRGADGPAVVQPGRTCWREAHADRADVLIDADRYYSALYETLCRAQRSIYVMGWDIDSRVELVRESSSALPTRLAPLLSHLARSNPQLDIFVLAWDFAPIFFFERELLPRVRFGLATHERVHFRLDDAHPAGSSHHQKLVVVDDRVAYCGGLDLCDVRWDTPEHIAGDPRRVSKSGKPYRPHHDVQAIVEGEAAQVLGDVARHRWTRATGERLVRPEAGGDLWPPSVAPLWQGVRVGVARTLPAWDDEPPVREVERLWLEALRSAEQYVYVEATHLTSRRIGDAFAESLRAPRGPEILMVLPALPTGWLEGATLGVLRDRMLERLRDEDRYGRLRVVCPFVPGREPTDPPVAVNVHGKVCIIDDRLLRIGSANLTNRSMGLDTECDLVIESGERQDVRAGIVHVRDRLLAEHLDADPAEVGNAMASTGSLIGAMERLRRGARTLHPCGPIAPAAAERVLPDPRLVDPDAPLHRREIMKLLMTERGRERWQYVAYGWWAVVGLTLLLANVAGWLSPSDFIEMLASVPQAGLTSLLVVTFAFTVGGLLLVPVTLLIANSGMIFGPGWGSVHALLGAFASAAVYYWMGRRIGHDFMDRISSPRLRDATRAIARRGLLAVAAVRLVPIAPHAIVGLAAGASRIGFRDYMLGSIVGMAPGAVVLVFVGHGLAMGVRGTSALAWLPVLGIVAVGLAMAWALQRRLGEGPVLYEAEPAVQTEAAPSGD